MALYAGMDLNKIFNNALSLILAALEPFRNEVQGIVVESTFNRYWLLVGLKDGGYRDLHLANLCAVKPYEGLKYFDDRQAKR